MTPRPQGNASLEGVRLGQGVNLLHGPGSPAPGPQALAAPPRPPLRQFPVELLRPDDGGWQPLRVTLHHDAASLAARLGGCHAMPHRLDRAGFGVPTALLMGGEHPHAGRGEVLGVDLAEGRSYLLFELRRIDGRADHEVTARPARRPFDRMWHLTPEWRKAGTRLRPGKQIHDGNQFDARAGADAAQRYVEAFYEFGTHFVSAVEAGDALVQVAHLRPEAVAEVSACFQHLDGGGAVSGEASLHLGRFLRTVFTEEVGPIVSLAGDPELAASRARGAWRDPGSRSGESLLAALHAGSGLAGLSAAAPLRVELTSLARFLEFYRGLNFERILRGALMQRWGGRVHLPLRRMPGVERRLAATVLHGEARSVAADGLALLHGDRLDLRVVADAAGAGRPAGCHRVVSLRGAGTPLHLGSGTLLAQLLDAGPVCDEAPVLRVADDRFDGVSVVCETMAGALVIENESGTHRDAVADGLRFTDAEPEPDTGRRRVRVRGDLHAADAAGLADLAPCVRAALARASVTLSFAGSGDPGRADAAAFAEWLAGLLPAHLPQAGPLRALALYLSRLEAGVPVGRATLDAATASRVDGHFAAISAAALAADELLRDDEARARTHVPPGADGAGSDPQESDTLARLRALRCGVSSSYLAILAEVSPPHDRAVRAARGVHAHAAAALARAAAAFGDAADGEAPGEAARAVLATMSDPSRAPADGRVEALLGRRGEEAADAALELLAREAGIRSRAARLQAIDALCASGADDAGGEAVKRALADLGPVEQGVGGGAPPSTAALRRCLLDGVEGKRGIDRALDDVLFAWERFDDARDRLIAAHGERCRDRVETWYHAVLEAHAYDPSPADRPARAPRLQIQLEQYRLLTTLGQALRRRSAAAHATGPAAGTAGQAELGAIGHLLSLRDGWEQGRPLHLHTTSGRTYT